MAADHYHNTFLRSFCLFFVGITLWMPIRVGQVTTRLLEGCIGCFLNTHLIIFIYTSILIMPVLPRGMVALHESVPCLQPYELDS